MITQVLNLPTAMALGASICFTHEIECGTPAENYLPLFGIDNFNAKIAEGFSILLVDIEKLEEANIVDSGAEISEQAKLEIEFNRLSKKWKSETSGYSSVGSMVMHPAYLEIISYGEEMIPYILKDLQNKPSHWFIALKTLAKISPVKPEDAGNLKKMTESWLAWGVANGKLS